MTSLSASAAAWWVILPDLTHTAHECRGCQDFGWRQALSLSDKVASPQQHGIRCCVTLRLLGTDQAAGRRLMGVTIIGHLRTNIEPPLVCNVRMNARGMAPTPTCSGHLLGRSGAPIFFQQPFRRRTPIQRCAQLRVTAAATLEAVAADEDEGDIIVKPPLNLKGRSRSRRFRDMAGKVPGRTVELGAPLTAA